MTRLFAGTPWDRPPTCDRCGKPETECQCPPPVEEPRRIPPEKQTARLKLEKRPKGKIVTVIAALDPDGNDLPALAGRLKTCLRHRRDTQGRPASNFREIISTLWRPNFRRSGTRPNGAE